VWRFRTRIFLVSALVLSEEGTTADGGESRSSGAGGVEKVGLLAALQAEGLRRGEEGVFANEISHTFAAFHGAFHF
jgi:hypothetical protein